MLLWDYVMYYLYSGEAWSFITSCSQNRGPKLSATPLLESLGVLPCQFTENVISSYLEVQQTCFLNLGCHYRIMNTRPLSHAPTNVPGLHKNKYSLHTCRQKCRQKERSKQAIKQLAELEKELYSLDGRMLKREITLVILHILYIFLLSKD